MQLSKYQTAFESHGLKVMAFTIDSPAKLRKFVGKNSIEYPILGDPNGKVANIFGIRNKEMRRGSFAYGVPHPGVILVATDGNVLGKVAKPGYKKRPNLRKSR
ncbi:MAG: hypothetical protein CMQ05_14635 [Gammaproteobacteria bacterium]|uniref:Alkyl hydroperoxide reductase subunit C/ Thiol specific antioxidant domain-containing protein n=1 Tax=OM182 bacterium MED-G24 TaxID=1986255 RepID=A0A2A5WKG0_9GAMM|nr:hypothetical protein [Gammaproteobacteria bacterium]PDH36783.1 MAG: hypothetical protein CNE99_09100 [OM182 bacterium MED-G24]RPG25453.1 MAG: hypothetical protein CBC10_007475 [Gammaproteobacteria bacterium TMED50]